SPDLRQDRAAAEDQGGRRSRHARRRVPGGVVRRRGVWRRALARRPGERRGPGKRRGVEATSGPSAVREVVASGAPASLRFAERLTCTVSASTSAAPSPIWSPSTTTAG